LASQSEPYLTVVAIEAPALGYEPDSFTVKNPEPGKRKIKEEFFNTPEGRVVRKRLTDMMFFFGQDFHLGIGPCEANDNQVINFINNRFLEMRLNQGSQLGHAAAVFNPQTQLGMMFAGFSGAGKSTLSLEVMKSDLSFLSNDRVLTSIEGEGLKMEGIPKHPRINPGTIVHNDALKSLMTDEDRQRYLDMGDDLWDLEEKYDGFIDQCFGKNKFKLVHPCQFLMLLNWKRNSSPLKVEEINLRERKDLMPAFMKQTGLFYLPDEAGKAVRRDEDDYLKHLERIQVFELSGGVDFKEAAKICTQLLKSNKV
ncbi:MAG: HprK-related kinase B, partial [Halobacteriovoraceae bacterium]|nr:HprK-related kinase B [Halobacteriovoraceae bacterium]